MLKKILLSLFVCLSVAVGAGYIDDTKATIARHCSQVHMTFHNKHMFLNAKWIGFRRFKEAVEHGTFAVRYPYLDAHLAAEYEELMNFCRNELETLFGTVSAEDRPEFVDNMTTLDRRYSWVPLR